MVVLEDPMRRTPDTAREIGVLDEVSGLPPGNRLEPPMTIP